MPFSKSGVQRSEKNVKVADLNYLKNGIDNLSTQISNIPQPEKPEKTDLMPICDKLDDILAIEYPVTPDRFPEINQRLQEMQISLSKAIEALDKDIEFPEIPVVDLRYIYAFVVTNLLASIVILFSLLGFF